MANPAPQKSFLVTSEFLSCLLAELHKDYGGQIAALEARIKMLEAKPQLRYCGVWHIGGNYALGSFVTHDGGLWIATCDTQAQPPGPHWQLCVKSGQAVERRK
jgi:hypothetical protein